MTSTISCKGQSTVRIMLSESLLYMDPVHVTEKADIILLSGSELGFDKDSIQLMSKKNSIVISPPALKEELLEILDEKQIVILSSEESYEIGSTKISVVPAYRLQRIFDKDLEKKNGYMIRENSSYYLAGPTDLIPEMNVINVDSAVIPVGGDSMDLFEALASTNVIAAKTFIPVAYEEDEQEGLILCQRFCRKCMYESDIAREKADLPNLPSFAEDKLN